MRGYLLDTNIIAFWSDPCRHEHDSVLRRIDNLERLAPLATSAIVLGEMEYGYMAAPEGRREAVSQIILFARTQLPWILEITSSTAEVYGSLRAKLFDRYVPKGKSRNGLRPCQLIDPVTSLGLGIQENDLWIAAQALEYNLVLVTHDKMDHIRTVAPELTLEDWADTDDQTDR